MSQPEPEDTLTFPVVAEDTEATETLPVAETEVLPALPEPSFAGASLTGQPERPFPYIAIGDYLIASVPGFDSLPCGHCGAVFDGATPDVLTAVRPLGVLRHLAYEAGWQYDLSLIWTCPECLQSQAAPRTEAERAEADAIAAAEAEHRATLREADRKARNTLARSSHLGGEFDPSRWRYEEDAAPGRAA